MKTIADIVHYNRFPMYILDNKGNILYFEYSRGFWAKRQYNESGNEIYYEDSEGIVVDKRP